MRLVFNEAETPVTGTWKWVGLGITESDILYAASHTRLTRVIQESKRKMRFTKNRFKFEMYHKRLVAAQTQLAALILSRE